MRDFFLATGFGDTDGDCVLGESGYPQWGQDTALSDTLFSHSGQVISILIHSFRNYYMRYNEECVRCVEIHIIKWPSGQVAYPQDVRALNSEFKRTLNQIDSKVVVQPFFIFSSPLIFTSPIMTPQVLTEGDDARAIGSCMISEGGNKGGESSRLIPQEPVSPKHHNRYMGFNFYNFCMAYNDTKIKSLS